MIALDEPVRIAEQGMAVEKEYMESMRQRLEKGYILPGQMESLYRAKEIFARLHYKAKYKNSQDIFIIYFNIDI